MEDDQWVILINIESSKLAVWITPNDFNHLEPNISPAIKVVG